jgi:purine nucleoside permease
MLDALVRRAEGDGAIWVDRVRRLRTATDFTDRPYAR